MDTTKLGTLERVDVRQAWSHEAHDFTPWLADNLNRLAAELGLELELEGTEVEVEGLRADIVARDSLNGNRVLIENQLIRPTSTTWDRCSHTWPVSRPRLSFGWRPVLGMPTYPPSAGSMNTRRTRLPSSPCR